MALPLAALAAIATGQIAIPDRLNPWAPLNLAEPPNFLTEYKLRRLRADPEQCRRTLATSEFRFVPVADRDNGNGCRFADAVQISRSALSYGGGVVLSCRMAVGMALLERHAVQPAALRHFNQPVVAIEHYGSYACRPTATLPSGRTSEHASANAMDVAGFRLRDSSQISLARDWQGDGAKALFLRDVRHTACGIFKVVLGPEYNAAHRDHFHFDMGPYSVCR